MRKIAIISTHPIQYNAPLFRVLSQNEEFSCKVFYTWSQSEQPVFDPGFGIERSWDIPLLEGYDFKFVENSSKKPGTRHFKGIVNPGLIAELNKYGPDAILIFGWSFHSHLACMRHFKGKVPILFRGDSTLLDEQPGLKKIFRRIFLTWVYRHIDYALYVGQHNKVYFLAHGLKNDQLVFAPHAVDNQRFSENAATYESEAAEWREKLGIKSTDMVVLFAGKLEDKKDPWFLLRMAKMVPDPTIKFLIIGNGHLEKDLKSAASAEPRIIFLDFQNQSSMPLVYRLADIVVLPSVRNETWGLAINEAMVCERPVITSDKVGCSPDLVIQGQTGWTFEPGEKGESDIASLLNQLCHDRRDLKKVGIQAFNRVKEYSYEAIVDSISNLIKLTAKTN
jgi:glycosyltransferase involved in cell wall biosynthesis